MGLYMLVHGNDYWIKIALGALIIGYSLYSTLSKSSFYLENESWLGLFICGLLSGILGGAYGLNGPPLVIYGKLRRWTAKQFRATLQAYFLPISLIGFLGYTFEGFVRWIVIKYFLLCLPAIVPAIFLGRYLNHKLNGNSFLSGFIWALIFIGLLLIIITVHADR